ncbi:MAG: enoyl-CoA hydratase/isomerase family protein [Candidatus Neomarinimicrobiota bacterium]
MGLISIEHRDGVTMVRLDRGVTNPIDLELVTELQAVVQEVKDDSEVRGLVLGSTNDKFFSIGFDIPQLFDLTREEFGQFYRAFNRLSLELYTLPKSTVAALSGHAIAGGYILALCCDYRITAEGRKLMGLNEIKLGVPVPYPADCILRDLVGSRTARDMLDSGEFYPAEDSARLGLVDRIVPPEQVVDAAIIQAGLLGSHPNRAFGMIKGNRTAPVAARINAELEAREALFIEAWYADETREQLAAARERF